MEEHKQVVEQITQLVEENLFKPLTLDVIAKRVGYSKYHLNRIFREQTGLNIHKYLQKRRLLESAKELALTKKPINEIALDFCYSSQQAYTLAFKQLFLCTPQVYRRRQVLLYQKEWFNFAYHWSRMLTIMNRRGMVA